MKVILIDVISLDGKWTKWNNPNVHEWSSAEDFEQFNEVKKLNNVLIMGSGTFDVVSPQPEEGKLRIVMTSNVSIYKKFEIKNQIEFTDESPKQLIARLEEKGYTQALIVGGKQVATSFFKECLINELWLTIEPKIFGQGDLLLNEEKFDINLKLYELKKLNSQGTLLLKYNIL